MRSIADHIYDITYNSIKAEAKNILLEIELNDTEKTFEFRVKDDGHGISEENLKHIFDPFYTTRDKKIRKVGLGLPLLKHNTELTKGYVELTSEYGKGSYLKAMFRTSSFDIPEIGDLASSVTGLITFSDDILWEVLFIHNDKKESITTKEIKEILGDIPINNINVVPVIGDIIKNIVIGLNFNLNLASS